MSMTVSCNKLPWLLAGMLVLNKCSLFHVFLSSIKITCSLHLECAQVWPRACAHDAYRDKCSMASADVAYVWVFELVRAAYKVPVWNNLPVLCMYICVYVCMYLCICMYVCMYVCIYVCMHVWYGHIFLLHLSMCLCVCVCARVMFAHAQMHSNLTIFMKQNRFVHTKRRRRIF